MPAGARCRKSSHSVSYAWICSVGCESSRHLGLGSELPREAPRGILGLARWGGGRELGQARQQFLVIESVAWCVSWSPTEGWGQKRDLWLPVGILEKRVRGGKS